jgi:hypothetical protein
MMKDRDQKHKALKLSVANRWLPQLEVDVEPGRGISQKILPVTDLDVLASIPDQFKGFRCAVIDCKTKVKESPVNRALWLVGVLNRINADQGICVLKKELIAIDHRLMATRLNIILLAEDEFDLYARATTREYGGLLGHVGDISAWDRFFDIPARYPKLETGIIFLRAAYWMTEDAAEACRKTLACIRNLCAELDPAKSEHLALFFDFCCLFARSLAIVVCHVFKAYLHPASQVDLSDALLLMLYGGREAYQHRNEMFKMVKLSKNPEQPASDLSLPEWESFLQLTRQLLDAPGETQRVPLILREVGFCLLCGDTSFSFAKVLCSESPQAARFALLIAGYLCKAAKLPPEFGKISDNALLSLVPIK